MQVLIAVHWIRYFFVGWPTAAVHSLTILCIVAANLADCISAAGMYRRFLRTVRRLSTFVAFPKEGHSLCCPLIQYIMHPTILHAFILPQDV
jgi:hypothetical protein